MPCRPSPTDRGKAGSKRHVLTDANGIPLAVGLTGANQHDSTMLEEMVDASYEDILGHCCEAWNKLTDQPWRIMSIALQDWAHRF